MNQIELNEIKELPDKYRPLTAWSYFGYSILFMIPLVGIICLIIFACDSSNINRRSYARSYFCLLIIIAILFAILLFTGALGSLINGSQK
jgi:hypothetical protein